ncbi:TPA: hypothetical protein EYP70_08385 [Candidatus Bathyarchaeota archaeon]|nr:hypothetical protein [Candidatus Bathyarchaeota archaeon]
MKLLGIGIGSGGARILDQVYSNLGQDRFYGTLILDTSSKTIDEMSSLEDNFILLGESGEGVGGQWKSAMKLMLEDSSKEKIMKYLLENKVERAPVIMVFAALGGGTGAGATPVFVRYLREYFADKSVVPPIVVLGVLPFMYPIEPIKFSYNSIISISNLLDNADAILLVDNDLFFPPSEQEEVGGGLIEVNEKISSFLETMFEQTSSLGTGIGGELSAQTLKSILKMKEASLCVPCYARVRSETVGSVLDLLAELALEEGKMLQCNPETSFRAVFVLRIPEENFSVKGFLDVKKFFLRKINGIDIASGLRRLEEGADESDIAVILVEPEIPKITKLIDIAKVYYDLHEEVIISVEGTDQDELEQFLQRLSQHSEEVARKRQKARELKQALNLGSIQRS